MIAAATKLMASEDDRLGARLVADPVDEDGDEEPEPDDPGRHEDDPQEAVAEREERFGVREEVQVVVEADEVPAEAVLEGEDDGVEGRVDEEDDKEEDRRSHPHPGPDPALLAVGKGPDEPLGQEDVADEDRRYAEDDAEGGDQPFVHRRLRRVGSPGRGEVG